MALGGVAWGVRAGCWHLHPHQVLSAEDFAPDLPPGALVSVAWLLDGAGRVVGGALPRGNPHGGAWGKRVLRGEGIWPAEMYPPGREITAELDLVEPGSAADPARIVVHGPLHDIPGLVDQPGLPTAGWTRMVTRLRRDSRRIRIQAGGRTWWIRASRMFGVRVVRENGVDVYCTRGGRQAMFSAEADDLDVSVVLLTLGSIPSSTYAPILGF
ncbi:hypothetical protein MXD59_07105 [Frankia sp. Ag45/Mut15]|uniref:Uncharacterized protein n=2 Tax=Frankia TaxID=1854 RepID=A0ABT0JVI3_9ACTN|nr:hypothetical protein [Frankia umida]MCK9875543.1 hypothetical protein [Frankia umida]